MLPLLAAIPFLPSITSVCPVGCPHTTLQKAIDAVPPDGSAIIALEPGVHDGPALIDNNRSITLVPALTLPQIQSLLQALASQDPASALQELEDVEPVTITDTSNSRDATLTTEGGSLTLLGIAIDGDLHRSLQTTDTEVSMAATVMFARGFVAEGGLMRAEGGSVEIIGGSFYNGSAAGKGGLLAIYDADFTANLASFSDGDSGFGACLSVEATGEERHTVTIDQATFSSCGGTLLGGAVLLNGALDATISQSSITESSAAQGGCVALVGSDLVVELDTNVLDQCTAFDTGGGVFVDEANATIRDGGITRSSAFYGGGLALSTGGSITLSGVTFEENSVVYDGAGAYIAAGSYEATDTSYRNNFTIEGSGGGLWLGSEASWEEDLRSTFCGNQAQAGGGIWADLQSQTTLHNLRLIDNIATLDGGGLYHSGGDLEMSFANLLGNSAGRGAGAAVLTTGDLLLRDVLIAYNVGSVAIVPRNEASVITGPTFWFGNERGDLAGLQPNELGAVFADPLLDRYQPGGACGLVQDWPTWGSPMRDAGTPGGARFDPDDTRADVGAYGGPNADLGLWETDRDQDDFPQIYDCDEGNADVNPGVVDEPYDGIDADCAFDDDFDADNDGYRRVIDGGEDCDDDEPATYPGAPEEAVGSIDSNCDGALDADGDGFVRGVLPGEEEPAELDCDDGNPNVFPRATELDDDRDYNCDGFIDGQRVYELASCTTADPGAWWTPWARR